MDQNELVALGPLTLEAFLRPCMIETCVFNDIINIVCIIATHRLDENGSTSVQLRLNQGATSCW